MAMIVRLVRGEWKKDEDGCYEHVSALEGFTLAVRLREKDGYEQAVNAVKQRLGLRDDDDVVLSYQWPQWMMGPEWKRANPIYIMDDEDMTLFMAIRADLEEVHLRVKGVKGGNQRNVNSYTSHMDLGGLTSEEISDKYWNNAETRAVWDSALTRLLTRTAGDTSHDKAGDPEAMFGVQGGSRSINTEGGIRIEEPINATPVRASIPTIPVNSGQRRATAAEKGKEHVTDGTISGMQNGRQDKSKHPAGLQSTADVEFEMFRRNYVAEMWRDVCATEMTLGGLQGVTPPSNPGQKIARALDFGPREEEREAIEDDGLRLTLAGKGIGTHKPTILTLSSTDSSCGTPSTESTSISFSTEDLMDDSIDINSPTGVIGTLASKANVFVYDR
ncbi:uncharacterized protein LOC110229090 [Arabidopsis lyrata subsp. lyrata]|uniref:uncharacterized protein LOC110229090 n=1 Tax=Arabidopsis lyrata subsp. lyrata TaxID=81972 RepID=UPI000A29CA58|nr:uncharacterized protein LOC110229090 [Arabidopsis lyrata subsp. lyrata]|eukprot:XP_020883623.1 uncharacterized protein LOC110229090 [Arabidopsis lyrata subsp. lyrata]